MDTDILVKGTGICKSVMLSFLDVQVVEDFLPLELCSSDVILVMPWLRTLGEAQANWEDLTLEFKIGDATATIAVIPH